MFPRSHPTRAPSVSPKDFLHYTELCLLWLTSIFPVSSAALWWQTGFRESDLLYPRKIFYHSLQLRSSNICQDQIPHLEKQKRFIYISKFFHSIQVEYGPWVAESRVWCSNIKLFPARFSFPIPKPPCTYLHNLALELTLINQSPIDKPSGYFQFLLFQTIHINIHIYNL